MKKKSNLMKKSSLIVNVKSNGLKTSNTNIDSTQQTVNPLGNDYNKNITVPSFTNQEIVSYTFPINNYKYYQETLNDKIKNENWTGQKSFMMDFSSGISKQEVINTLMNYEITPNIIYYTHSHTEQNPRFRVVILLDNPVNDNKITEYIRKGLIEVFDGCITKFNDSAKMFLDSISIEKLNIEPNDITNIINMVSINLVKGDNMQTRKLQDFRYFYNNNNRSTHFYANTNNPQLNNTRINNLAIQKNNSFNFEIAKNNLKIVDDFANGKELNYKELFGLTTNFIYVKGGEKFLKETMIKNNNLGYTKYKPEDFAIIPVVKYFKQPPESIEYFSPYKEDYKYTDVFEAVKMARGEVKIIKPVIKIELSEAEAMLNKEFDKAIQSNDNNIYIFSTQTAIGKTTKLTKLNKTTLAFPTHDLKDEVDSKMKVEHLVVPEIPIFSNKLANEQIKAFYDIGLNDDVYMLINTIADFMDAEYSIHDRELARKYLTQINESYNTTKTVLTTHLRALFDQYGHKTIVFDEDPIKSLLSIEHFELSDLLSIEQLANEREAITKLIDLIRITQPWVITQINHFGIDKKAIATLVSNFYTNSNLIQFFDATSFCKDKYNHNIIHYQIKREIPQGKKVIIMSATPQIEVYKSLYGDRVKIIDIPLAESQGKIIQHTKNGYSRSYLKRNEVPDLKEQIGDRPVITFKKHKDSFPTAHQLVHYGNCEGYDFLNGVDLAVVGTPHKNELYYMFTAYALGIDLTSVNLELQDLKIDWKGYKFRFTTYEDERLRNIQLGAIEAELVQAIGRARCLRTDAEVLVYSNLPLQISTSLN